MNKEKVLDCESIESIDHSLESILGVPISEIEDFLINFDFDNAYEKYSTDEEFEHMEYIIVKEISNYFDITCDFNRTNWFHITRAFDKKDFKKGIHPLNKIIDKIWKDLFNLVNEQFTELEWMEFRKMMDGDSLDCWKSHVYKSKFGEYVSPGPFALLIRDHAFSKRNSIDADYHDLPEVIRDICDCFDKKYDYDLLSRYLSNTKKYIIKFTSNKHDVFDLGAALLHKYVKLNGRQTASNPRGIFNGKGATIPPEDILRIDDITT